MSVVAIALIALFAATSWWILRTPLQPEATAQRPRPEGVSERSNPVPPGFDRSDEPASTQSEHSSGADPAALFDERGLNDWVARQDWFVALQQSLPQGVRANFHVFEGEGEDSGWDMVEIREHRAIDSGYDADVSPMIGIFRVSRDRRITEAMDVVDARWVSPDAFMSGRSRGAGEPAAGDPRPVSPALVAADGEAGPVSTPERGSPVRKAISDAVRDHVRNVHARAGIPDFLFVIEHLKIKGNSAAFQGYPVNPDGSPMDSALGDTVFSCLLAREDGRWRVVVDLTRSDVPSSEEIVGLRNRVPAGFPPEVLTDFWRNLLFP